MADATFARQITRLRQRRTAPLILELDLTQGLIEGPPADPLNAVLSRHKVRLGDVLDGLRRASEDDRVQGLIAKVGGQHLGDRPLDAFALVVDGHQDREHVCVPRGQLGGRRTTVVSARRRGC